MNNAHPVFPTKVFSMPFLCRAVLSVAIAMLCSGCYLIKQGMYVVKYSCGGRSFTTILRDKATPPELRDFVLTVQDINRFGVDSIGLRKNRNYTRMVGIDREYLVDVVTAARDTSFEQYNWCWPFFGCFPYKGYFERADALREAGRIATKGYDVSVRRADGFSTLGFFNDPVYSFMKEYSVFTLASLILHEQTHATLFVKSQVEFNEALATFVGDEGGLAYVRSRHGEDSEQYRGALLAQHDYHAYTRLLHGLHRDLDKIYKNEMSREKKLARKDETIARFKQQVAAQYDSIFQTPHYRGLDRAQINNAYIAARMTYTADLGDFYRLYDRHGRDLGATFAALKKVRTAKRRDPAEYLRTVLLGDSASQP